MKKILVFIVLFVFPINVLAFNTSAKSSILMDIDSGRVLYANNSHHIQSVASISKIMTAVVALENTDIKRKVTIGNEINKAYGSGIYIKKGEVLSIENLLYGLLLRSGNDAALAIANNVCTNTSEFVELMNEKARSLNMNDTIFNNPSGLDEEKGNYSSAYDMAVLMSYAMRNKEFRRITSRRVYRLKTNKNTYKWVNKNKLLRKYKYTTGGKTGFTVIARRTLVTSAKKNDLNLTAVTLNDGNDWADHINLYKEAFDKYKSYRILNKGNISILGEYYYKDNDLYLKKSFSYPLLDGEKDKININFLIDKKKTYKNRDKVGNVYVYLGDKVIASRGVYVRVN